MNYGYVYLTRNLINGKLYIGQHSRPELDPDYIGSGVILLQAIEKYGRESFSNEVLCFCKDQAELDLKEIELIAKYREDGFTLYNITSGGRGLDPETASTYAKERWEKTPREDRVKHTEKARAEYLRKLEAGEIEKKICEECGGPLNAHRKSCSNYNEGKTCEECGGLRGGHYKTCSLFTPYSWSDEAKARLSETAKNRPDEVNQKIADTLKDKWKNGEMDKFTCEECGGKSSNHKTGCSKATMYDCPHCERSFTNRGNLNQHVKGKHKDLI